MNNIKNIALVTAIGLAGAEAGYLLATQEIDKKLQKDIMIELQEVKNLNVKDYENITNGILKFDTDARRVYHLKNALDSLNMKAAVEKAYLEGAQMVRDSIKTATKAVK